MGAYINLKGNCIYRESAKQKNPEIAIDNAALSKGTIRNRQSLPDSQIENKVVQTHQSDEHASNEELQDKVFQLRQQVWALELELRRRDAGAEALRRENTDVRDLYSQSQLEVTEAVQMIEAIASLPSVVRARELASRIRDEKLEELNSQVKERDQRIAQLEKELKKTKKDLEGVCWVQAQLLNGTL